MSEQDNGLNSFLSDQGGETTSTFVDLPMDLSEVEEPKPVPAANYDIMIDSYKFKEDGGKVVGALVVCSIIGYPDAANILHNVSFPQPGDDAEKRKNKMLFLKRFMNLFGMPLTGNQINFQEWIGKTATAALKVEPWNGVDSNKIVLPAVK